MKDTYYFIAIGGIGMSGLAKYLVEDGFRVLGSDIKHNRNTVELEKLGARIFIGHNENNLPDNAIVVASTAIKEDNPELLKAKRLGLEILHRSDLLAKISKGLCDKKAEYFIGYSGTHGKTTTSGLSAYVLEKAGLKPSFVVGGIVPEFGINSNAGGKCSAQPQEQTDLCDEGGSFFIAELDESDGTIVNYQPEISVINNLEIDHVDFYTDGLQSILDTFKVYLHNLPEGAKVLISNDNEGNLKLIEQNKDINFITFGLNDADYVAKNIFLGIATTFDIYYKGKFLINLKTQMFGKHNVYNATAVLASLNESGVNLDLIKEHFYTFTGMGRRFQLSAEFDGICVYDDYAHHPTEIRATLAAAKILNKNIIAVFQPHRYSRLHGLWSEFLNAFDDANQVFITDVYAASEAPIEGVTSSKFVEEMLTKTPCEYLQGTIKDVAGQLLPKLNAGDIVIGLGAGTITTLGKDLLEIKDGVKV